MDREAQRCTVRSMPTGATTSIASLPTHLLEAIAILCSPSTAAISRGVCRTWRSAFAWPTTLRLLSQRPAEEALDLVGRTLPPFPRATCAKLLLATSTAACSQAQLDAWLDALRQRTAITHLTLTSANTELTHAAALLTSPPLTLARLATLQHLRALVVGPTMTQAGLLAAVAAVGHLTLLTRLRFTAPCSQPATAALTAALTGGLPHLVVLKLCPHTWGTPHHSHVAQSDILSLLSAAAAGAPCLRVLVVRLASHQLFTWRAVVAAFDPAALLAMRVLVRGLFRACRSSFLRLWKAAGSSSTTMSLRADVVDLGAVPTAGVAGGGPSCSLCARGLGAVSEEMQRQGMAQPHPSLESISLTVHRSLEGTPELDLSSLPATTHRLILLLGDGPDTWPSVSGAAPQVTCLKLSMTSFKTQPLPLAALAAACPRLNKLSVDCDMQTGGVQTWGRLTLLTRLTQLVVNGDRHSQPDGDSPQSMPAPCLAPSLVELHLNGVRVPAAAHPPSLGRLRRLGLSACYVEDFGVFSGAAGVRRVQAWDVSVGAGAEALLRFQELEDLHDRTHRLPEGIVTVSLFAAKAAADNGSAAAAVPLLPRLRRLRISSPRGARQRPLCPEDLLEGVPLQELHLEALQGGPVEGLAEWLRPLGRLRSLVVCEVSGVSSAEFAPLLQAVLLSVVVEVVAA